jgi:dienelactone hydrolase
VRYFSCARIHSVAALAGVAMTALFVSQGAAHCVRRVTTERAVDLPTRPGHHVRALVIGTERAAGSVILLAGGHGNLDLDSDGCIGWGRNNQLVRTRHAYAARGLVAIVPDVADDFKVGSGATYAYRWSAAHAQDLAALVAFAAQIARPVYLIGTSRAALSVANLASRPDLRPQPDAVVITSGMLIDVDGMRPSVQRNVPHLDEMRAPMLVLYHKHDLCRYTPASSAEAFRRLASGVSRFDIKLLSGGTLATSGLCKGLSAHGFRGLDRQVVDTIVSWLGNVAEEMPRPSDEPQ